MNKLYKSKIMAAIHEMEDLHTAEVLPAETLREFDALCLTPTQQLPPQHEAAEEAQSGTLSA